MDYTSHTVNLGKDQRQIQIRLLFLNRRIVRSHASQTLCVTLDHFSFKSKIGRQDVKTSRRHCVGGESSSGPVWLSCRPIRPGRTGKVSDQPRLRVAHLNFQGRASVVT